MAESETTRRCGSASHRRRVITGDAVTALSGLDSSFRGVDPRGMDPVEWAEQIAQARAVRENAKTTRAAARNHRHTATLRRALDKLVREPRADRPLNSKA